MYLAAIADAQPQMPPQMPPHPVMQQTGHYMQHPQAALAQQAGIFPSKIAMQYIPQLQDHQHQQLQQAMQGHMGMRPVVSNGMHPMHTEANLGGVSNVGPPSTASLADFSCGGASAGVGAGTSSSSLEAQGGSKADGADAGSGDAQGNSTAGHSAAPTGNHRT